MSTQVKMAAQRERPHRETIFADECLYQCGDKGGRALASPYLCL
jgi:hypothetical protein